MALILRRSRVFALCVFGAPAGADVASAGPDDPQGRAAAAALIAIIHTLIAIIHTLIAIIHTLIAGPDDPRGRAAAAAAAVPVDRVHVRADGRGQGLRAVVDVRPR